MNTSPVTIEIPTEIYEQAAHLANMENRTPEEVLAERLIQSFAGEEAAESVIDLQMAREVAAFEAMHPELVRRYLNRYVALSGGKVVDVDEDQLTLFFRIEENYPDSVVLIRQVLPELPGDLRVRSPRFAD